MPQPRHVLAPTCLSRSRAAKLVGASVVGVLVLGVVAAAAARPAHPTETIRLTARSTPAPLPAATAPARSAAPVRAVVRRTAKARVTKPAVKPKPKPKPRPSPKLRPKATPTRAVTQAAAKPAARWLPTGTGMWLHDYAKSEHGNGGAVVARAKLAGLTTLYVQTGSSKKGWIGGPTLRSLLPATKGTDIKVVAWDFPKLDNPEGDAMRLARAARFYCAGCPRVAAVAPDVETAAEGARASDARVARYYHRLRRALPADVAILATVPWPSEKRRGRYPYARTAATADAIMPMAYWYNRSPAVVTATSMGYLKQFGRPVMPVGQGYDGRIDAPRLSADPDPAGSVRAFLATADRRGAQHVSLWSWQTTGGRQWGALARGNALFRPARTD